MVVVFKQKADSGFWTNPTPETLIKECIEPYMRPCTDHATKTIRFTYEKENDNAQMMKGEMWPMFHGLQMFNDWEVSEITAFRKDDCKDKEVVMTGLTIKMEQENLFEDWELVPGWTWKPEKKEYCCRIL
ncbi:hypothetical protein FMUND_15227 [Fusarium mundagurra]|uniref:Uncharacterized protein n=1 Tax=Fusarium mundagurra TaxID=1567541 RepID=A0A8H5XRA0_9HYPO|nr:hypothetical protein FMUND_15227 [Fusarium mundagurra]